MTERALLAPRRLEAADLDEVVRIDAIQTGRRKRGYWERVFEAFLGSRTRGETFGFGVEDGRGGLAGFVIGEVRAFEFGSSPCGWVFAVGVDEPHRRRGIAAALLARMRERFAELGVHKVRTMVRRADVPVLSFFRSRGFVGGPYVQLELDLEEATA